MPKLILYGRRDCHLCEVAKEVVERLQRRLDFDVEERAIAEWVIGNIDDDGYLQSTTEEMARRCAASEEAVEAVVLRVQTFDPSGVAARDLQE